MMNKRMNTIAVIAMAFNMSAAWAQDPAAAPADKAGEMEAMPGMDHGDAASRKAGDMSDMNHGGSGMDHGSMSMQGGKAPSDARDPHAYSGGHDFGPLSLRLADQHNFSSLLVDNLETMRTKDSTSVGYGLQAWYGRTYNRAVLKAEGEVDDGRFNEARTELLWGHAVAVFWDTQLGVRYDSGEGPNRSWLTFGVQGLAPIGSTWTPPPMSARRDALRYGWMRSTICCSRRN